MVRNIVAGLMLVVASTAAPAYRYTATYGGYILGGIDDFHEFGDPATLPRSAATVTFLIDSTYGDPLETMNPTGLQHELFIDASPVSLPVTVTVNGVTHVYAPSSFGIDEYEQATFPPLDPSSFRYTDYGADTLYAPQHYAEVLRISGAVGSDDASLLSQPLGTAFHGSGFGSSSEDRGVIRIRRFDPAGTVTGNTDLTYIVTSLDIALASAVPEPRAWALMVLGFGLVGGALRARPRRSRAILA